MTRDWIVGAEARKCGSYTCASHDGAKAKNKFSLDKETGIARFGCGVCGRTTERQLTRWRERRACKGCQYVRTVTITRFRADGEEYARGYCDACSMVQAAASHRHQAQKLADKAEGIYSKRGVDVPTGYRWVMR